MSQTEKDFKKIVETYQFTRDSTNRLAEVAKSMETMYKTESDSLEKTILEIEKTYQLSSFQDNVLNRQSKIHEMHGDIRKRKNEVEELQEHYEKLVNPSRCLESFELDGPSSEVASQSCC